VGHRIGRGDRRVPGTGGEAGRARAGPGCRARGIPGAADARADGYDRQVAEALAAADAGALAAIGPGHDGRLHVAGRAAWQVLAGAAAQGAFDAELRYSAAPFEVTYHVASWRRRAL
jgi:hypothetical protein